MSNSNNNSSRTSFLILFAYLISSIFAGLVFSGLALRAKSQGGSSFGWGFLSLVCILIFGYMGFAFFKTSSPFYDAFYYYLGIITLISNTLALMILTLTILKKS